MAAQATTPGRAGKVVWAIYGKGVTTARQKQSGRRFSGFASAALQQYSSFHMVGIGELVEQGAARDPVAVLQFGDVRRQGFGVAGDVQDPWVALHQLQRGRIQSSAGRIDEDGAEPVTTEVDALQAAELAHPGQGLGNFLAGKPHQGDVIDLIVGDILHSRVARSNVDLLTTLGAEVTLVAPPTLLPVGIQNWNVTVTYNLDEAVESDPDAIMMLRVQHERMTGAGGGFFPSPQEYHRLYGLNMERMRKLPDRTILLHPGPMNRGLEISAEAADQDRSVVLEQVENGVYVRMAVLYLALANEA